jgi:hypothetical protein
MEQVAASFGLHATQQSHPEQGKVANDVQNFVTDKLIGNPQTRLIQHATPGEHDGVVERSAPDEIRPTQGLDFFDEAKRSRRSNVAPERAVLENDATDAVLRSSDVRSRSSNQFHKRLPVAD